MEKMKPWSDIQVKDLGLDVKHMKLCGPALPAHLFKIG